MIAATNWPTTTNVLDTLIEILYLQFNCQKRIRAKVKVLRAKNTKVKMFGPKATEAQLVLTYSNLGGYDQAQLRPHVPPRRPSSSSHMAILEAATKHNYGRASPPLKPPTAPPSTLPALCHVAQTGAQPLGNNGHAQEDT